MKSDQHGHIEELEGQLGAVLQEKVELQKSNKLLFDLLELTQRGCHFDEFLERAAKLLQGYSGCRCCGIRLVDTAGNVPYHASQGFSEAFIQSESQLSLHRDRCMCINVFLGKTLNKEHSFYTDYGSFFTNGLSTFAEEGNFNELGETRNVCLKCGFETLALFPIRRESTTIGLLQLADSHAGMLPPDKIETLEIIARQLGSIILRYQAEARELNQTEQLEAIAKNVPGAIYEFCIGPDGSYSVPYMSEKGQELLDLPLEVLLDTSRMFDKVHPDDRESFQHSIEQASRTLQPWKHQFRIMLNTGEIRWIKGLSSPRKMPDGSVRFSGFIYDMTDRKKAEELLVVEKARAESYLNIAATIILGLDLHGNITLINDSGAAILGCKREECMGKNWFDHFLPKLIKSEVKSLFGTLVKQSKQVDWVEGKILTLNGEEKVIRWYNRIIKNDEGDVVGTLSSGEDITSQKLQEQIQAAQLRLVDYASRHSIKELLQKFLDEAEILTDSVIGFYHFIEADQQTVSLQTWSTRTMEKMCTAEGEGLHYPISYAGVWVDCVRQKKPVIHNNYANLPNKKGLPAGHAPIIRELVVAVIRDDKVAAILGVGNKTRNYDQRDVETIQQLADFAWELVVRRQVEERLNHEQYRLAKAQEIGSIGTWELDLVENILTWTQENHNIFGIPDGTDLTYETFLSCVHPDDREYVNAEWLAGVEGKPYDIEHRIIAYGQVKWVREKAELLLDDQGNAIKAVGVTQDITVRKKMEIALRESEQQFRVLSESSPVGVYRTDVNGHCTYANSRWLSMAGLSLDQVLGDGWKQALHPEDRESISEKWYKSVQSNGTWGYEYRFQTPQSVTSWVYGTARAVHEEKGEVSGYIGVNVDITEQKNIQMRLAESEERFRLFYEHSPLPYQSLDAAGNIIEANPAWCRLLGYEKNDILGRNFSEFITPDYKTVFSECFPKFKQLGEIRSVDFSMVPKEGDVIDVEIDGKVSYNIDGQFRQMHCVLHDVTERKRAEKAIVEYQQAQQALSSQLTLIQEQERRQIATQLHDGLAQELVGAKIQLNTILMKMKDIEARDILHGVNKSLDGAIDQVRNLTFDLTNPTLFEFGLAAALKEFLQETVQDRFGFSTELTVDHSDYSLICDEYNIVLYRIARELILNAVKHSRGHTIEVDLRQENGVVHVQVCDDGVGFDVERVGHKNKGSKGLGLFSIKQQVEYYGGTYEIVSLKEKGTTVTYAIPLRKENRDAG